MESAIRTTQPDAVITDWAKRWAAAKAEAAQFIRKLGQQGGPEMSMDVETKWFSPTAEAEFNFVRQQIADIQATIYKSPIISTQDLRSRQIAFDRDTANLRERAAYLLSVYAGPMMFKATIDELKTIGVELPFETDAQSGRT